MTSNSHRLISAAGAGVAIASQPVFSWWVATLWMVGALVGAFLPDLDLRFKIPHRTITHWAWWPILLWQVHHPLAQGVALGWALHILADGLTTSGVQLFWPVKYKMRGPIITGGWMEHTVMMVSVAGLLMLVIR